MPRSLLGRRFRHKKSSLIAAPSAGHNESVLSPSSQQFSIFSSQSMGGASRDRPADGSGLTKAAFIEKVRRSNEACQRGDFAAAVQLYSDALRADPQNCILYSNRSAAFLKLGQSQAALDDAIKARLLNPKWPKVGSPRAAQTSPDWSVADPSQLPSN
ncbi:hypothetical protein Z043_125006 [Scleropages formosus]|uniref:Uncharacterized protein n=1 Tax=Scleropages formosus TaxID=113540 RepID=A0A0P7TUK4_SCLFO|nr:hypothetical protein Z043_125006 [Scleropages formosus]